VQGVGLWVQGEWSLGFRVKSCVIGVELLGFGV
jgi:hypothetical protein